MNDRHLGQQRPAPRPRGKDLVDAARFGVPPVPAVFVPRPRLTATLDRADRYRLVVVSAPAGTGKTVAVAEWLRAQDPCAATWVTFEDGETGFWPHTLEALRRLGLDLPRTWTGSTASGLGGARLKALASLVASAPEHLTLVLDGHPLASSDVAGEVDYLLHHSGDRLRLVLVGRVDPVLPLYRYRLTEDLLELRAPDLAFTDAEAGLLIAAAGIQLEEGSVHDLNRRLRGWAAGVRFAARALAQQEDPTPFVAAVVAQTSDINEYLVREVLDAQPPAVRGFLLETSVADVVSAEVVELLSGPAAVRTMDDLMARRAFVELVPGQPGCFRYHPFFRDLLRAELFYEAPARASELATKLAGWLREQGLGLESLVRLARVGAWEEVTDQIVDEGLVGQLLLEDSQGPLHGVLARLPVDLDTPRSCTVRAALALAAGDPDRCHRELAAARQLLGGGATEPALECAIAAVDALAGCLVGTATQAAELATRARLLVGQTTHLSPGQELTEMARVVEFAHGVTALRLGHLHESGAALLRAVERAPLGVSAGFRADCWGRLALVDALQGRLCGAVLHAEESLANAAQRGADNRGRAPSAHVALAIVGVERCDADLARAHLELARANPALAGDPVCSGLVESATAVLEHADGRRRTAWDRIDTAVASAERHDAWTAARLRVEAARLGLREGGTARALATWEPQHEPHSAEEVLAAVIAHSQDARLTDPGAPQAAEGRPVTARVAALLAVAVGAGQDAGARVDPALAEALRVAAPERLRRLFVEIATAVPQLFAGGAGLVQEHRWLGIPLPGTQDLGSRRPPVRGAPVLVDPLTAKEIEVLGNLAALLTTEEIAEKLFVSVNTVRTHIRHILTKLGVNRRNAAIRRARELGLLDGTHTLIPRG